MVDRSDRKDARVTADGSAAYVTIDGHEVRLEAAELDSLIAWLGEVRGQLTPQHSDWYGGQKVHAITNPAWFTEPDLMQGDSLLHIRHPGFGWLHFLIPKSQARRLIGFLSAQVEQEEERPDRVH